MDNQLETDMGVNMDQDPMEMANEAIREFGQEELDAKQETKDAVDALYDLYFAVCFDQLIPIEVSFMQTAKDVLTKHGRLDGKN